MAQATYDDVNLILRLYDMRREETLRKARAWFSRSEEHTSELQSPCNLVCRLLLEKKKRTDTHVLVNFLPVGSQSAPEMYAEAGYRAGWAFEHASTSVIPLSTKASRKYADDQLTLS